MHYMEKCFPGCCYPIKHIEFTYYAFSLNRKDCCCHCGDNETEKDAEQAKLFEVMLVICKAWNN